jgi:outer membrane protein assembly factor BamD
MKYLHRFLTSLALAAALGAAPAMAAQRGPLAAPPDPELESMAKHNLEVAEYYFSKKKAYDGAKDRLLEVVTVYPEYTRIDRVYFLLGEIFFEADDPEQAREYFERLLAERPDSKDAERARKRLAQLPPAPAEKREAEPAPAPNPKSDE